VSLPRRGRTSAVVVVDREWARWGPTSERAVGAEWRRGTRLPRSSHPLFVSLPTPPLSFPIVYTSSQSQRARRGESVRGEEREREGDGGLGFRAHPRHTHRIRAGSGGCAESPAARRCLVRPDPPLLPPTLSDRSVVESCWCGDSGAEGSGPFNCGCGWV